MLRKAVNVKIIRKAVSLLLCVCFAIPVCMFSASAESGVYKWDGTKELKAGNTYIITDTVKLRKDIEIPRNTKLSVKKGGELKIYKSGSITVRGELAVAIGGLIFNSGSISVKKGGEFNVYGALQSSVSGHLNLSGTTTVYRQGVAEISSVVKGYKGCSIVNRGSLSFYKSSQLTLSGEIRGEEGSQLHLQGIVSVTLSGVIDMSGHLTVGSNSDVRCSGTLILDEKSSYTRFKVITITKSGKFLDSRPEDKNADMTIGILADEKRVKRRGIDVSYAQGEIDWKKVADSGIDFAIIRAGRGRAGSDNTMKEDDYFRRNITEAQKYGIDVGVYFYSYATSVSEAKEEARFFVDIIKGYQIQYPVILDMEEKFQGDIGTRKLTNMIEAFFEVLIEEDYFPMFYSYKAWLEQYLDMTILDKYAIWLAQVSDSVTYEGGYYIWQYSFTGKVSGIEGDVDLDISYRDFPEILKKHKLNNLG